MKAVIVLFLVLFTGRLSAQIDTVISNAVYSSYFSYKFHQPLFVMYKLYRGGGDCSRAGMHFITGGLHNSATAADYAHHGYDEGHLCNAEDEAGDCDRERLTFRFYNCVPQTPRLNRGIWKIWETNIRQESQGDSLLVICGSIFGDLKIGNAYVPVECWKVVYSLSSKRILHCMTFPNDNSDTVSDISFDALKKELGYDLPL